MKTVAKAMRDAGLDTKLVKQVFYEGVPDVEWLPHAIAKGWVLLTKDDKWRYRPAEKEILINAKAMVFVFVSKTAKAQEIADTIVHNLRKMTKPLSILSSMLFEMPISLAALSLTASFGMRSAASRRARLKYSP